MLSSVNNNQPSFQGMYVIKGSAIGVKKASDMIYERCGNETKKFADKLERKIFGKKIPDYVEGFEDYSTLNLVPSYSEHQPQFHRLIATNEHVRNVANWYATMVPPEQDPIIEKIKTLKIRKTPYGAIVEGDLRGIIQDIKGKLRDLAEKIAPYKEAEEAAKNGNMDKMADFLIDNMQQVKQRLQEVRDLATVPYPEPKVLNAKDVIAAIRDGRFDFITGEIRQI